MKHRLTPWQYAGYLTVFAMQIIMGVVGLQLFFAGDEKYTSLSFLSLGLTLLPFLFNYLQFRFKVPALFIFIYTVFIFTSMFMGEVFHFYAKFTFWDIMLHFSSGVLGVVLGYWLVLQLKKHYGLRVRLWFAVLFGVCLSITLGVSWEIAEFASDEWFGTLSQEESLFDTMHDIVLNAGASVLTVAGVVLHAKIRRVFPGS